MKQHEQAVLLLKKAGDDEALLAEVELDRETQYELIKSLHLFVENKLT